MPVIGVPCSWYTHRLAVGTSLENPKLSLGGPKLHTKDMGETGSDVPAAPVGQADGHLVGMLGRIVPADPVAHGPRVARLPSWNARNPCARVDARRKLAVQVQGAVLAGAPVCGGAVTDVQPLLHDWGPAIEGLRPVWLGHQREGSGS